MASLIASPNERLRIIVADDHILVREGICFLIDAQPDMEVVAQAGDGEAALLLTRELNPDIVLMDVSMPKVSGAQATERIHICCPHVRVLAVSMYDDDGHVRQMLTAGASGYLLKKSASGDLINAIRTLGRYGVYLDCGVRGEVTENHIKPPVGDEGLASLNKNELEILQKVANGYSNKAIAAELNFSIKTIEGYKAKINEKMKFASRVDLVEFAKRQGWFNN